MNAGRQVGFPRWRKLRGASQEAKSDLLSLGGAFATAVSLGLAREIFPDQARAGTGHRIIHGLVVVVGTLAIISLADAVLRLVLYGRRSRRTWIVRMADHAGLLGFGIDSLKPAITVPDTLRVVVQKPSGDLVELWPDPQLYDGFLVPYPPGRWVHIVEQPYAAGHYEVRAYSAPEAFELIRATFVVPTH